MLNMNTGLGLDKLTQTDPNAGMNPSIYEQRRNQIAALPPGPQKEEALANLLRDYEGQAAAATADRDAGQEMFSGESPEGTHIEGKYGTYVAASPVEHLAAGLRNYKGAKQFKSAQDKLSELSEQQQKAREGLFRAGMGGGTKFGMQNRLP